MVNVAHLLNKEIHLQLWLQGYVSHLIIQFLFKLRQQ
jgi:hypothetical protein